ncbi:MAG: DUF4142 domain-containing protein [Pseudonocardiaceae bacterium]
MRPPIPRFVLWTVALAMITALSVAVFQYWGGSQYRTTAAQGNGWTQTQWGPLGPADRDLLIKVRQAGLWEGPTGQDAQQRATSVRVREAGRLIATEHADLDARVREVAARLEVALPNQPSDQQRGWITELTNQSGPDFDRAFVQRLRTAHGNVLPIISQVRAGTRNDLVRQFATTAAQFVTRHHEYLERTGLVDYAALPEPPAPATAPQAAALPPAAAVAPAVAKHGPHLNEVARVTPVTGAPVMIVALVYLAAPLAIVGLLWLLGTAGLRARRARPGLHRSFDQPGRPRHAAHRW